jgi:hypothetical protein
MFKLGIQQLDFIIPFINELNQIFKGIGKMVLKKHLEIKYHIYIYIKGYGMKFLKNI